MKYINYFSDYNEETIENVRKYRGELLYTLAYGGHEKDIIKKALKKEGVDLVYVNEGVVPDKCFIISEDEDLGSYYTFSSKIDNTVYILSGDNIIIPKEFNGIPVKDINLVGQYNVRKIEIPSVLKINICACYFEEIVFDYLNFLSEYSHVDVDLEEILKQMTLSLIQYNYNVLSSWNGEFPPFEKIKFLINEKDLFYVFFGCFFNLLNYNNNYCPFYNKHFYFSNYKKLFLYTISNVGYPEYNEVDEDEYFKNLTEEIYGEYTEDAEAELINELYNISGIKGLLYFEDDLNDFIEAEPIKYEKNYDSNIMIFEKKDAGNHLWNYNGIIETIEERIPNIVYYYSFIDFVDMDYFIKNKTEKYSIKIPAYPFNDGIAVLGFNCGEEEEDPFCSKYVEEIYLPETLALIDQWSFSRFKYLKSVVIPESVLYVGYYVGENMGQNIKIFMKCDRSAFNISPNTDTFDTFFNTYWNKGYCFYALNDKGYVSTEDKPIKFLPSNAATCIKNMNIAKMNIGKATNAL